jgi:hypothetical protein
MRLIRRHSAPTLPQLYLMVAVFNALRSVSSADAAERRRIAEAFESEHHVHPRLNVPIISAPCVVKS